MQKPAQKKKLQEFVRLFTDKQVYHELEIVSKSFYEVPSDLKKIIGHIDQDFFAAGDFLGKIDRNQFVPSVSLLHRISKVTKRIVIISDKVAWLFVCGRNILDAGVVKGDVSTPVIVMNKQREVLGYGFPDADVAVKNKWDIGDFLRRERRR